MELLIFVHQMDLTQRLQNYVEKKTGKLDRYMPNLTEIRVDLTQQNARSAGERQVAQITVRDNRGTILRAEESSSDMFAAIDAVVEKLYRQIKRYRGKRRDRRRIGVAVEELVTSEPLPLDEIEEEVALEMGEVSENIVRRKRFELMPMSPDEAVEQMELLGHDFYVFFNAEEAAINVIYKRRDGNYGLLMPELS